MLHRILPLLCLTALLAWSGPADSAEPLMRADGIHTETWVKDLTFLELKNDLDEALQKGKKGLVLIFEQPGCGSCRKLHEVNFADRDLVKLITDNFDVIEINLYGEAEVTDFDGEALPEKALAEKMLVNFTPTTVFFGPEGTEVFRVPGYLKPKFYRNAFEYVLDRGPQRKILFPRWIQERKKSQKKDG